MGPIVTSPRVHVPSPSTSVAGEVSAPVDHIANLQAALVAGGSINQQSPYISIKQLALRYDRPIETVRTWRKRGLLPPAYRFGGMLYWLRADIENWEKTRRERLATAPIGHVKSIHRSLRIRGSK